MNHESPCISINHKLSHFENTLVLSKTKEEKNAPYATTKKKYTLVCISQQITNYLRYLPSKKKKKIVRRTQRLAYTQIAHTTNRKKLSLQLLQGSRIIILLKQEKKKKTKWKEKVVAHCERKMQRHKKLIIATWRTTDSASFIGGSAYLPGVTEIRLVSC